MRQRTVLTVLAVGSMLVLAGCTGGTSGATTTTTTATATTTEQAVVGENGNRTARIAEAYSGTEMRVRYADGTEENVTLAAVRVPGLSYQNRTVVTTCDPADFYFHEPADAEEAGEHRQVVRDAGYEAHMYVHQSSMEVTVRPAPGGGTDAEGNKLVYMYFEYNDDTVLPLSLWYVAEGWGVMVDDSALHAAWIADAQEWAKSNDKGLWGENEEDESHEGRPDF